MNRLIAPLFFFAVFGILIINASSQEIQTATSNMDIARQPATPPTPPEGAESIVLGAGCFWCTEAVFEQQPGVISVTSGYMGGSVKNPTYEQVCDGDTGHAEVSKIVYDPQKTSLEAILNVFWHAHDPTQLNRQGNDIGTQYRSAIFYGTDAEKAIADKSKAEAQKTWPGKIVTEITKATEFYPAENYHQEYYRLNKNRNPYCQLIIRPKLKKLGLEN